MAPVYSSAFALPTTNKIGAIGAMGAMVPAYFSMTRLPENRKTPQHATDRRKTPILTKLLRIMAYFIRYCTNESLLATEKFNINTVQNSDRKNASVIRRKTPQDVTDRRKSVTSQNA